ncbi:hypothetical protein ACP70R_049837 [Stipagrostis hirtigluma subsp. patula]
MESSQGRKDDGARTSSPSCEADDAVDKGTGGCGDDEEEEDDDEGTRQPYKCTFCRRGFPTAQALGGHMNVHRKHRGRSSSAAPIAAAAAAQGRSSCYEPYPTTLVAFGQVHPASASSEVLSMATGESLLFHAERAAPQELRLFGGRRDCAAGPGELGGAGDRRDHLFFSKDGDGDHGEGEELDLELRLGGAGS